MRVMAFGASHCGMSLRGANVSQEGVGRPTTSMGRKRRPPTNELDHEAPPVVQDLVKPAPFSRLVAVGRECPKALKRKHDTGLHEAREQRRCALATNLLRDNVPRHEYAGRRKKSGCVKLGA
jgi:hypothetical protein